MNTFTAYLLLIFTMFMVTTLLGLSHDKTIAMIALVMAGVFVEYTRPKN